jgi:uncharacterized membrane protein YhhN
MIGILALMLLIIGLCSFFISRIVYRKQVKSNYKNPAIAASIVFVLTFAVISAAIFFLIVNNIRIER